MGRTEKGIRNFVKKKLEEAKGKLAKIGDGYKYSNNLDTECCVLEAKIKAYEEVLNFISEEPKIVGVTTVDKAFERFLLDACPEVKKKLKALETIKRKSTLDFGYIRNADNYDEYLKHFGKVVQELLKSGESIHFAATKDEFNLLKEVLK